MKPSSRYPAYQHYHTGGYPASGQHLYAYDTALAAYGANGYLGSAMPLGYDSALAAFRSAPVPGRLASPAGQGMEVTTETQRYGHLDRLTFLLTAVSVCAIVGLLMAAALVARQASLFGELPEPDTDGPLGLVDLHIPHRERPGNDTVGLTDPTRYLRSEGHSSDVKATSARGNGRSTRTSAHIKSDVVEDVGGTGAPSPTTSLEVPGSQAAATDGDHPQSDTFEGISRCGRAQFTYCENQTTSFYHVAGATGGACLSSERGHLNICNRSPNSFGSLADCRKFCEELERPQERCGGPATFSTCARTDMKRDWWFHDGISCRQWEFPSGTCPTASSDAYETFQECFNKCGHPTDHRWQCREPHPTACDVDELRHPYFAISAGDGKFKCLEASPDNLRGHICLTGENNFNTQGTCEKACLRKPPT